MGDSGRHREPSETDYSPTATCTSRVTHVAQCVVFGAVMSDAAMLDAVLELDVWDKERVEGGRRPSGLLYLWNQRYNSVCTE